MMKQRVITVSLVYKRTSSSRISLGFTANQAMQGASSKRKKRSTSVIRV